MRFFSILLALLSLNALNLAAAGPQDEDQGDWLISRGLFRAVVIAHPDGIEMKNGLARRFVRTKPGTATVVFDNVTTGAPIIRSVRPEAIVELNGMRFNIGGLVGQPVHNFLKPQWLDSMRADPTAWECTATKTGGRTEAPFPWKIQRKWLSTDVSWPPRGAHVVFEYSANPAVLESLAVEDPTKREVLMQDDFTRLGTNWKVHASPVSSQSSFQNEGKAGEIMAFENTAVFAESALPPGVKVVQCQIDPGTDKSASWGPGLVLVWPQRTVKFYLRPGKGTLALVDNGTEHDLAEVSPEKPYWLRVQILPSALRLSYSQDNRQWIMARAITLPQPLGDPVSIRLGKTSRSGGKDDFPEHGNLDRCRIINFTAFAKYLPSASGPRSPLANVKVQVHYELYDGLPLLAKWITVHNFSQDPVTLNSFIVEQLAVVEPESIVDGTPANFRGDYRPLEAFSDYSFGGNMTANADAPAIRWKSDPLYGTQVHYERKTPCLLECAPPARAGGRDQRRARPSTSFRVFELLHDSTDRERRGLAVRRAYRALAPWVQENPDPHACAQRQARGGQGRHRPMRRGRLRDGHHDLRQRLQHRERKARNTWPRSRNWPTTPAAKASRWAATRCWPAAASTPKTTSSIRRPASPAARASATRPASAAAGARITSASSASSSRRPAATCSNTTAPIPATCAPPPTTPGHAGLKDSQWTQWKMISDFYQVVPRAGHLPERAGLVLPGRLHQVRHGLPRDQLVPAARPAGDHRAPEHLRRHLGKNARAWAGCSCR